MCVYVFLCGCMIETRIHIVICNHESELQKGTDLHKAIMFEGQISIYQMRGE